MLIRKLAMALFFVFLSIPAYSHHHHGFGMMRTWGMTSDREIARALHTLQQSLNLSPAQVTNIRELAESRRESLREIREQARPKFEELRVVLTQPDPDPAVVGSIVLQLKKIRERARSTQMDLERQLTRLLNPAQQQIVDNLRNQAPTFYALRSMGLLGAPGLHRGTFMSN